MFDTSYATSECITPPECAWEHHIETAYCAHRFRPAALYLFGTVQREHEYRRDPLSGHNSLPRL